MRSYPRNSAQAAARLVALAMLADGHYSKTELDAWDRHGTPARFGLEPQQWNDVVHGLCEDLLATAHSPWDQSCQVDPRTLEQVLAEIDDEALRRNVLRACCTVVEADEQVTDGEWVVLTSMVEQWGLELEMLATSGD